jgi:predicted TPR repeat methyltransferase
VLDLGCGTGLAGAAFAPLADRLVGVDLSPAMVAQAESKQLYDRLVTGELAAFLKKELDKGESYDLVVAADVFVYVADLAPVLAAAAKVLAPSGVLAFTVETHPDGSVKLLQTLRYAHSEPYIRHALSEARLTAASLAKAAVRSEKGVPVDSLVVIARA